MKSKSHFCIVRAITLKTLFKFENITKKKEIHWAGLEIATDTVANATNIFSLATKNSGLVAKVATRF